MSVSEVVSVFSLYGVDVIILSVLTAILVQVLKITVFKNLRKKFYTFLPFIIGTLLYSIYAIIVNRGFAYFLENYSSICQNGVAVGTIATLIYVLFEQFLKKDTSQSLTESVISALISGHVLEEKMGEASKAIAETLKKEQNENQTNAAKVEEILNLYRNSDTTEGDIKTLSQLIVQAVDRITFTS